MPDERSPPERFALEGAHLDSARLRIEILSNFKAMAIVRSCQCLGRWLFALPGPGPTLGQAMFFTSVEIHNENYYSMLGVSESATQKEIKDAFRKRAKELHPDVSKELTCHDEFLHLVGAYEVLVDPLQRREYDLTRQNMAAKSSATPRTTPGGNTGASQSWRWGLEAWRLQRQEARRPQLADSWRSKLREYWWVWEADLDSALTTAYLGPSLDHLSSGELPRCFEAEERASSHISGDVLHVVSGRTLLGTVRERAPRCVEGQQGTRQLTGWQDVYHIAPAAAQVTSISKGEQAQLSSLSRHWIQHCPPPAPPPPHHPQRHHRQQARFPTSPGGSPGALKGSIPDDSTLGGREAYNRWRSNMGAEQRSKPACNLCGPSTSAAGPERPLLVPAEVAISSCSLSEAERSLQLRVHGRDQAGHGHGNTGPGPQIPLMESHGHEGGQAIEPGGPSHTSCSSQGSLHVAPPSKSPEPYTGNSMPPDRGPEEGDPLQEARGPTCGPPVPSFCSYDVDDDFVRAASSSWHQLMDCDSGSGSRDILEGRYGSQVRLGGKAQGPHASQDLLLMEQTKRCGHLIPPRRR